MKQRPQEKLEVKIPNPLQRLQFKNFTEQVVTFPLTCPQDTFQRCVFLFQRWEKDDKCRSSLWCMDVSKNSGTPKSSILIGFSIINHPFWGVSLFLETPTHGYSVHTSFLSVFCISKFGVYLQHVPWRMVNSVNSYGSYNHLGVSKNRGTPQNGWFIMENPIFGNTIFFCKFSCFFC